MPDTEFLFLKRNRIGFCVPDVVLWSSAKKKPEPQLYESIQSQTFFDIIGKINRKSTKNTAFPIRRKEKRNAECPRYRINSLEILTRQ